MTEPQDPLLPKRESPQPPPTPSAPESVDDSGSQALSEALRSSFAIVKVIMLILVVVFFASGFFTVSSQEKAIILRFGRVVGAGQEQLLKPGAHWSFPYPIDEVVKIPFSQFQTVRSTVGWYATTPELEASGSEPQAGPTLNPAADGYTLTSDTNIIHVRATLRYRINQPLDYALKFVNASNLVQNALNNSLLYSSAYFTVDQALRESRQKFKETVTARVQQLADQQALGINVEQLDMDITPPRYVKPNFDAVLSAEQERRHTNQLATTYKNKVLELAVGQSNAVVNAGLADADRLVQDLAARAKDFTNQLPSYRMNPEFFMARLKTETFRRIMTNEVIRINFLPEVPEGHKREIRIQVSPEMEEPASQQPNP